MNLARLVTTALIPALSFVVLPGAAPFGVPALDAQQAIELPARDRSVSLDTETLYQVGGMQAADWQTFGERIVPAFSATGELFLLDSDNYRIVGRRAGRESGARIRGRGRRTR